MAAWELHSLISVSGGLLFVDLDGLYFLLQVLFSRSNILVFTLPIFALWQESFRLSAVSEVMWPFSCSMLLEPASQRFFFYWLFNMVVNEE